MALETFNLYDVLTDIIPGIVFQMLLVIIFVPSQYFESVVGFLGSPSGVLLLVALGYILGRIVRNSKPFGVISECHSKIYDKNNKQNHESEGREQKNCLIKKSFSQKLSDIISGPVEELDSQTRCQFMNITFGKLSYTSQSVKDRKQIEIWGFSKLYGRTTLYHKYTMISNFYYSMSKTLIYVVIFGNLIFFGSPHYPDTKLIEIISNILVVIALSVILAVLSAICWLQYRKFSERRAIAFVNDLVALYNEESKKTAG